MRVSMFFEPRDIWIGVFWCHKATRRTTDALHVYVCLVPMFPILLVFEGES